MSEFHDKPPYKWKTVRVFISSTFRDFHAERDYLIKYVFPELRQWCEKQKLHLIDIDLRWGVTEKEAESGKVIELCLEQIDGCRPFFICMLGSRYGWIPNEIERNKVNEETLKNFPDLKVKWENLSVTHLEILHAALSPLQGEEPVPHSFFYFRDKKSLPGENELKLYSAEQSKEYLKTFLEEEPQKTEKLDDLKKDIEGYFEKDGRVFPYTPKFDISLSNPEDDKLKGRFTAESLSTFGNKVKEHLLHALEIQFASRIQYLSEKRVEDSIENEREFHEAFIENRTALFIGRTTLLQRLHQYVNSYSNKILAVYGESGCGKSSLLAKFYREFKFDKDGNETNRDVLFIPHFVGASPSSSALQSMLRRFCEELKNKFHYEDEIPFDLNKLVLTFTDFLEKAKSKLIILIDGLNQLDETNRAQELDWLPCELPEHLKIIACTLEGKAKDALKILTDKQLEVGELDEGERREIIRELPTVFAKTLEEKHINVLLKKKATSNPLYLKVALEELRIFGSFEKLEEKVGALPDTVIDMFVAVLERLEKEIDKELVERLFSLLECSRYGLTENELEELLNDDKKEHIIILRQLRDYFFSKDGLIDFFHRGLSKAVRQKYNFENESIHWHNVLAKYFAKQPHFFDGDKQKKPNVHKCLEQPWQETKGAMWDEVTETLCDLNFIQSKCAAKHTYDLFNDYTAALESIPDNADSIRIKKERQARLDKYSKDLVLFFKGEINKLEVPESITPWSDEKSNAELERIKTNPGRADSLKEFYNFLGHEVDNLHKHAQDIPHLTIQQAWNYADSGTVAKAAEEVSPEIYHNLLLRASFSRPPFNPLPQSLKILKGHTSIVFAVSITPDGRRAISGSWNGLTLWDLNTGEDLKNLKGHTEQVNALSITPDGNRAVSGSKDCLCVLWDLNSGQALKTLKRHTKQVYTVAITPDGRWAISRSEDDTCILWDLNTGESLNILEGHTGHFNAVDITTDGKMVLINSEDNTCIVWDLKSGMPHKDLKGYYSGGTLAITPDGKMDLSGSIHETFTHWGLGSVMPGKNLPGHNEWVNSMAFTPDGRMALLGSRDRTCILWDRNRGESLKILKGHTGRVTSVAITPDGRMALSGSVDKTCILWDLERGVLSKTLKGQTSYSPIQYDDYGCAGMSSEENAVAITPNGKTALSGSADETCMLWDLQSGMHLKTIKGPIAVKAVAITPDGKMALSASRNGYILGDLQSGITHKTFERYAGWINAVAITPDGNMALSGSTDNSCILWDLKTGRSCKTLKGHTASVNAVAIAPDGKMALSGSGDKVYGYTDTSCILWDLGSGLPYKTLKGHTRLVSALAISPDGKMALSGSYDRTCILWDLESGMPLKTFKEHTGHITDVAITPDGKMALSASRDMTCILWDLESGEKRGKFFTNSKVYSIKSFPRGIVGGNTSGETLILNAHRELLCPGIGIITARKIWDFEFKRDQPLSADCPFCGIRFSPPELVLDTIEKITERAGLSPEQSPCLELSKEVWEEPGLLSECPQCGEELKFNPFIVDDSQASPFLIKWRKFWEK